MLLQRSELDVWIDPRGSRRTDSTIRSAGPRSPEAAPRVDYVITGRITDFHHAVEPAQRGLFGSKKPQAIVAIDFQIVDTRTGRVVAADHVSGVEASDGYTDKSDYTDFDFGSYAFWATPLGRATETALDKAATRFGMPTYV